MDEENFKKRTEKVFWSFVKKTDSCWIWTRGFYKNGYGQYSMRGTKLAHRVSYEFCKGKIPKGKHLDHICRNRACVNPNHLEIVTCKENILRGIGEAALNSKKTHCPRGHAFIDNSYTDSNNRRICSPCKVIAARIYRKKRKHFSSP